MVEVLREGFDLKTVASGIRLVCLDLDGTLMDPSKRISTANKVAVARVRGMGIEVAIATGRHPFNVAEVVGELGIPANAACLSGAYAEFEGHGIFASALDDELVRKAIDLAEEHGAYISISGSDYNKTAGHINRGATGKSAALDKYETCATYAELIERAEALEGTVLKVSMHTESDEAYRRLRKALLALDGADSARSDARWVDVTARGCSKASGIEALAAAMGRSLSEVAAIGDDENDVASLAAVGLGIAMGNACAEALAAADAVTLDNAHDGVAVALNMIAEARKSR